MNRLIEIIQRLNRIRKAGPVICIGRFGQLTDRPGVDISIRSRNGLIGVQDWLYSEYGETVADARAGLYADDLSHITGLPVVDERPNDKHWPPEKAKNVQQG
jgi:hypothetical protein